MYSFNGLLLLTTTATTLLLPHCWSKEMPHILDALDLSFVGNSRSGDAAFFFAYGDHLASHVLKAFSVHCLSAAAVNVTLLSCRPHICCKQQSIKAANNGDDDTCIEGAKVASVVANLIRGKDVEKTIAAQQDEEDLQSGGSGNSSLASLNSSSETFVSSMSTNAAAAAPGAARRTVPALKLPKDIQSHAEGLLLKIPYEKTGGSVLKDISYQQRLWLRVEFHNCDAHAVRSAVSSNTTTGTVGSRASVSPTVGTATGTTSTTKHTAAVSTTTAKGAPTVVSHANNSNMKHARIAAGALLPAASSPVGGAGSTESGKTTAIIDNASSTADNKETSHNSSSTGSNFIGVNNATTTTTSDRENNLFKAAANTTNISAGSVGTLSQEELASISTNNATTTNNSNSSSTNRTKSGNSSSSSCDTNISGTKNISISSISNNSTHQSRLELFVRTRIIFQPKYTDVLLVAHFNNFISQQIVDDFIALHEDAFPQMVLVSSHPDAPKYRPTRSHIGGFYTEVDTTKGWNMARGLLWAMEKFPGYTGGYMLTNDDVALQYKNFVKLDLTKTWRAPTITCYRECNWFSYPKGVTGCKRWLWYAACAEENNKRKLQQSECAIETYKNASDTYKRRLHSVCDRPVADSKSFTVFGNFADFAYIPAKRREEALQIRRNYPYIWNMLLGIQFVYLLSMLEEPGDFQAFQAKYVWSDEDRKTAKYEMLKYDSPDVLHALKLSNEESVKLMRIVYSGGKAMDDEEEDRRHGDHKFPSSITPSQKSSATSKPSKLVKGKALSSSASNSSRTTTAASDRGIGKMCTDTQVGQQGSITKIVWVPITSTQTHIQASK